jgi:hypothetical protein
MSKSKKTPMSVIYGKEPTWKKLTSDSDNYNTVLSECLQWYGNYAGVETEQTRRALHKEWLTDWAKENISKKIKLDIPNSGISSVASLARLSLRDFPIKDVHEEILKERVLEWKVTGRNKAKKSLSKEELQKRAFLVKVKKERKMAEMLAYFDGLIDNFMRTGKKPQINFQEKITGVEASELRDEYTSAKDLLGPAEGYDSKAKVKKLSDLYDDILTTITVQENLSVIRKVRKKTVKAPSTQVKKLKYSPVFGDLGLVSFDAEKLVGAETVYVYDTKTRKLKVFNSNGGDGITVSGTTLKNCTVEEKMVRKPETLKTLPKPKTKVAKYYNELTTKPKETSGRINANCILLRVF